jgi:hypothetical protein
MARTLRKREEAALTSVLDADYRRGEQDATASTAPARAKPGKKTPRSLAPDAAFPKQPQQPDAERPLQGHVDLAKWPRVKGWVWDPSSPGDRIRLSSPPVRRGY